MSIFGLKMSAEESNPVVNQFKQQINSLETELIRFKLIAKSYQKYFDHFNEINETIYSNEVLLNLKNDIKDLIKDQNLCFVSVEKLNENQLNQLRFQTNVSKTYVKTRDISTQTDITETNHDFRAEDIYNETQDTDWDSINQPMSDSSVYENKPKYIPFVCGVDGCPFKWRSKKILRRHKAEMHSNPTEDSNGVFVCEHIGCRKQFKSEFFLRSHRKIHSRGKYKCEWKKCTASFDLKKHMYGHMNKQHYNTSYRGSNKRSDRKIRCILSSCKQWFPTKEALNLHILTKHKNVDKKPEVNEQNIESEERNLFSEKTNGLSIEGIQSDEIDSNDDQNTRSLRPNRKRKPISFSSEWKTGSDESDDNDIKTKDKSDTDYDSNEEYLIHSSDDENGIKRVRCHVKGCSYSGRTRKNLLQHKWEMHSNPTEDSDEVFVCEYIGCGKKFKKPFFLKTHQKTIHSGVEYKCEWEDCTAVFPLKKYLARHMNKHKGIYRCTHEGCTFIGSNGSDVRKHEIIHSEDRQHVCLINDCNKIFQSNIGFKDHQLRAHPQEFDGIPWFECIQNDCIFKTKSKSYFDKHQKQHIRPSNCDECQKSFATPKQLRLHMCTHSSELKIPCDWPGCDRLFSSKHTMLDHLNRHTLEISHSCYWPSCDKTFTTKSGLNAHIRVHKGLVEYDCPHCDYKNTRQHRLRDHIKRKHENQTFESIEIELIDNLI